MTEPLKPEPVSVQCLQWPDILYAVRLTVYLYWVEFLLVGLALNGQGYCTEEDWVFTQDIEKAEPIASGSVKFDDCSNWQFHTEEVARHFCGRQDVERYGQAMLRVFDTCKTTLEANAEKC